MVIAEGYFYHIKDAYFFAVNEATLMSNYENSGYRPHYFAIKNLKHPDIFWMVPVSSQYEKYKALHDKMAAKYRRCTKIVLGKCGGKDAAYLIQNAFPVTADYLDHVHTLQGKPLTLHTTTANMIIDCLRNNLRLHEQGINLFFADISRLFQMMTDHLKEISSQPIDISDATGTSDTSSIWEKYPADL